MDWVNRTLIKGLLYAAFSLCFLWPFVNLAVWMLPVSGEYKILVGTWGSAELIQIGLNGIAFISGSLLCVLHVFRKTERRSSTYILLGLKLFGLLALLLISNTVCLISNSLEGCHHSFTSPDGTHTIIVQETQIIHDVRITVHERVNPLLVCVRAREVKNNTIKPIELEEYSLQWDENSVTFFYNNGRNSIVAPLD